MTTVRDIEQYLYAWAPRELAESWDNVGLLVGDPEAEVRRVLVALDVTPQVVDEAIEKDCRADTPRHRRHLYAHQSGRGGRWRQ